MICNNCNKFVDVTKNEWRMAESIECLRLEIEQRNEELHKNCTNKEKIEEILTEIDEDNIYNAKYKLTTWWLQLTKEKENK